MSQDIEHCGGADRTADLASFVSDLKETCSCDKVFLPSRFSKAVSKLCKSSPFCIHTQSYTDTSAGVVLRATGGFLRLRLHPFFSELATFL